MGLKIELADIIRPACKITTQFIKLVRAKTIKISRHSAKDIKYV
jgi:hypothetical protein